MFVFSFFAAFFVFEMNVRLLPIFVCKCWLALSMWFFMTSRLYPLFLRRCVNIFICLIKSVLLVFCNQYLLIMPIIRLLSVPVGCALFAGTYRCKLFCFSKVFVKSLPFLSNLIVKSRKFVCLDGFSVSHSSLPKNKSLWKSSHVYGP